MSAGDCRPVSASCRLRLGRVETAGRYLPGLPRDTTAAAPVALPDLVGASTDVIRARVEKLHIEVDPDWSGSTFSVWGGDPRDVIGAVAISLYRWQRRYGGGTAGVVPWGTTPATELAVGPVPVRSHLRELRRVVRSRVNLGGNDLPAALEVSAARMASLAQDTVRLVWVPTDGIEAVTARTHAAVAALPPGSAHLVLIDPLHGCSPAMEADWRSVAFGSVTRIEDLSVKNVATTIARLCADALGLALAGDPSPTPAPARLHSVTSTSRSTNPGRTTS